ncbi:MAG TPA: hypothetical protein VHN99_07350, partial [Deinococcales bacterium]|nr:hypothetical protein [Deinococcales bacterium]
LTFDGRYAQALDVGALTGPAVKRAYLGARARAFYGLAFVDATATASETTDANANPTTPSAEFQAFYVYPGAGYGFGGSVDLGAAADLEPNLTVGLGVVGAFSASSWTGTLYTSPAGGTITTVPETRSAVGPSPYYTVNVAFRPLDGPLGGLLLAADLRGGRGSASLHAGLEGQFGPVTARAGLGYDDGLNLGAGASFALGPAGLDLALTSHTAPFTAHQDFGIAATLRFGF